jgi:hypothetical protein
VGPILEICKIFRSARKSGPLKDGLCPKNETRADGRILGPSKVLGQGLCKYWSKVDLWTTLRNQGRRSWDLLKIIFNVACTKLVCNEGRGSFSGAKSFCPGPRVGEDRRVAFLVKNDDFREKWVRSAKFLQIVEEFFGHGPRVGVRPSCLKLDNY